METLTADGSNSNDAVKDYEKAKIKFNGELNGSVEAMDVDADSHDSDYKKEMKDSYSGDGSNDGSSRVNNGGEHSSETDGEHSGEDDSRDVDSSNSKLKHSENSNSHQGHESMDVDGESMNSEEEANLLNSDNERTNSSKNNREFDAETVDETEEDEEYEEEGDINKGEFEPGEISKSNKDVVDLDSDDPSGDKKSGKGGKSEGEGKTNGDCRNDISSENSADQKSETAAADSTNSNETTPKKKKEPEVVITPRRSSRTVQKPVRFGQEKEESSEEEEEDIGNESDEIEEITPQDPLADPIADSIRNKIPRKIGNTTIVVNDTKRLADIAARNTNNQKKEPTLVIIDTNSILSGRGAVPMAASATASQSHIPSVTVTPQAHLPSTQITFSPQTNQQQQSHHVKPYPNLPAALPAQGLYPPKPVQRLPPILPTLTDDMYVVEAPSFIVPYVYEKPPVKKFKKYLRKMLKQIKKQDDEEEAKEREEEKKLEEAKREIKGEVKTKEGESEKTDGEKKDEEIESEEVNKEKKTDEEVKAKEEVKSEGDEVEKGEIKKEDEEMKKEKEIKKENDEAKVSSTCDSIEDSIKVNEIKKKEDGDVTVKESTPAKKLKPGKKDGESSSSEDEEDDEMEEGKKKPTTGGSYFDNPLGKFFMQIGMNLVQEFVQTDLLKQHKKKQKLGKGTEDTQQAIISLKKNLQLSKENNEPYTMEQNKCDYCSFKTESKLIMAHHLETPHMRNYVYRCNFCPLEVRGPHDILFHMEAEHNIRGRLERAPAFHQCPQCPFEDNQKGKLTRHLLTCAKKFRPEKNLEPPLDWEPPAKIPRMTRKPPNLPMNVNNPLYQQAIASKNLPHPLLPKMVSALNNQQNPAMLRARGRPNFPQVPQGPTPKIMQQGARPLPPQLARANMVYRTGATTGSQQVIVPASYQISGNQIFQVMGPQGQVMNVPANSPAMQRLGFATNQAASVTSNTPVNQQKNPAAVKLLNQPSISITPLPRQTTNNAGTNATNPVQRQAGAAGAGGGGSKTTFVICEICDGYIKDLEQLRNHMQWIHKVKIHPKMIYNRPPLNCQKCQFRFFTDQGLERHLLGSHGLVTSSMQDSANKGKDGGRCPVCGRVYQWKLLNHVSRDHSMTLKPAHLSYKCTVCTATFGMYKQFENHVYSAHSVVAKRVMEKKNGQSTPSSSSSVSIVNARPDTATLLKPLKINDEITIIPQPAKKATTTPQSRPVPGTSRVSIQPRILQQQPTSKPQSDSVQVIDLEDSPLKTANNGDGSGIESLTAVKERLRRRKSLEIRQVESEPDHSEGESEEYERESTSRSKANSANEEEEEEEEIRQDEKRRKPNEDEEEEDEEEDEQRREQDQGNDQEPDQEEEGRKGNDEDGEEESDE